MALDPISRSSSCPNAAMISPHGRARSTSPPGFVWRQVTRYRGARFCRREQDGPEAALRRFCDWLPWQLAGPRLRWEHSTGDCLPVPENRKPSPRQPARLPCCSTMRCVTVWITSIRVHHITRPAIGSGLSKIFIGVPRPSASSYRQQTSRLQSKPFLRKVAVLLGLPASSDDES